MIISMFLYTHIQFNGNIFFIFVFCSKIDLNVFKLSFFSLLNIQINWTSACRPHVSITKNKTSLNFFFDKNCQSFVYILIILFFLLSSSSLYTSLVYISINYFVADKSNNNIKVKIFIRTNCFSIFNQLSDGIDNGRGDYVRAFYKSNEMNCNAKHLNCPWSVVVSIEVHKHFFVSYTFWNCCFSFLQKMDKIVKRIIATKTAPEPIGPYR